MKKYNDMNYEIKKKEELLQTLDKKERDLDLQIEDSGNLVKELNCFHC